MNSMKRQKDRTLKDELPRSAGAQYATGDQWRNNSKKNEGMEPKQKHRFACITGQMLTKLSSSDFCFLFFFGGEGFRCFLKLQ